MIIGNSQGIAFDLSRTGKVGAVFHILLLKDDDHFRHQRDITVH
jgi:hypothetical protein